MDMNYNLNQPGLGASVNLTGLPPQTNLNNSANFPLTPQSPLANLANLSASYPNVHQLQQQQQQQQLQLQQQQQQLQQLNAQIASMSVTDTGTNYLDALIQQGASTPTSTPVGPFYVTSVQESPRADFVPPLTVPGLQSPLAAANGNFVTSPGMVPLQSPVPYANAGVGLGPLAHQNVAYSTPQLIGSGRVNVAVPNSLPLQQQKAVFQPTPPQSYTSSPASSPATPKRVIERQTAGTPTFYGSRPRQQVSSPPGEAPPNPSSGHVITSDTSSTASSTSVPSSPVSTGRATSDGNWSDASGPRSPDYYQESRVVNGEGRPAISPIKNQPLHMQTRYPQDKCYACMKKAYPMEKLGPVRGVVYHKGCFKCKICSTKLTLKNFFHNQSEPFDLCVYCKSHQPSGNDKGPKIDSESFLIKSALIAPKTGTILTESERAPVHAYNIDANSREMKHALKTPVADLQAGNKIRNKAWSKSKREPERVPPADVVRHDDAVPEYDMESYRRHQVETNPDYGGT